MQMKFKLTVLAAVASFAGSFAAASYAQDMVVKIGHVGPISGSIAHLGKDNENGAKMAVEELNAKGVMIGGKKVKLELVLEDDAGDPKQGTAVAQKLADMKVSGVIGHLNSGTSIPASKFTALLVFHKFPRQLPTQLLPAPATKPPSALLLTTFTSAARWVVTQFLPSKASQLL